LENRTHWGGFFPVGGHKAAPERIVFMPLFFLDAPSLWQMENLTLQKALDAAYRLLAGRPHTQAEIKRKLSRKGAGAEITAQVLDELARKGYIDEAAMALRWAQALVRERLWGPLKISAYLMQKGLGRELIDQVQRSIWGEFNESEIAGQALRKRFGGTDDKAPAAKKAAFLRSRGFSSGVIYSLAKERVCDDGFD
jgi:regulatory protein